jgi:phage shock protein E
VRKINKELIMFISCEETKKLIKEQNAQFVDVRTPEEFQENRLPGAVNIPLQIIDQVAESELKKDVPVVVFCRSGQRSGMAMQILKSQGFVEVHNMGPSTAYAMCPDA